MKDWRANPQSFAKERHCAKKRRYSEVAAEDVAARMRKQGETRIQAYQCVYCGNWHVGHAPRKYTGNDRP